MKKLFNSLFIILVSLGGFCQSPEHLASGTNKNQLPVVYLPEDVSVHFISPEPITYVDLSTKSVAGDLPLKNVLRIKRRDDRTTRAPLDFVVTIAGEKYIAQYRVVLQDGGQAATAINIIPQDTCPLEVSGASLSEAELRNIALRLAARKPERSLLRHKAFGIRASIGHIYTLGDYFFMDMKLVNNTRLRYDIDGFRFEVRDKKVIKASNEQSLCIKPVLVLLDNTSFARYYRNIFVFKKIIFPGNKVLHVELSEKQISGRIVALDLSYHDVLGADAVPL